MTDDENTAIYAFFFYGVDVKEKYLIIQIVTSPQLNSLYTCDCLGCWIPLVPVCGIILGYIQCESKKHPLQFSDIFPKWLGIYNQFFTHLLHVHICIFQLLTSEIHRRSGFYIHF